MPVGRNEYLVDRNPAQSDFPRGLHCHRNINFYIYQFALFS